MKKLLITLILCVNIAVPSAMAQLRCNVAINTQKIQSSNRNLFQAMKNEITSFVNNRAWGTHNLLPFELIECNFIIAINEQVTEREFKASMQIQAQRPIFGTTYNSPILNMFDYDFEFEFSENEMLDFSDNTHLANLTSTLAFWVYIVLGTDYDTFSPLGGTDYFKRAERIVQGAQSESRPGWQSTSGTNRRNRYWLIENILGKRYDKQRMVMYKYHRLGLDVMAEKPTDGREEITKSLKEMAKLFETKPDNTLYFYSMFFDAKADELVSVFSEAPAQEKKEIYDILSKINTSNEVKYKKLK
ncbi:MAG: DUF4835 family protein [Bacteroidales bacterium]